MNLKKLNFFSGKSIDIWSINCRIYVVLVLLVFSCLMLRFAFSWLYTGVWCQFAKFAVITSKFTRDYRLIGFSRELSGYGEEAQFSVADIHRRFPGKNAIYGYQFPLQKYSLMVSLLGHHTQMYSVNNSFTSTIYSPMVYFSSDVVTAIQRSSCNVQ